MSTRTQLPDLAKRDDLILITGASGFIGARLVSNLLSRGFTNLRCLVRSAGGRATMDEIIANGPPNAQIDVVRGNLLSREDCARITKGAVVIYHLAAGRGEKSYPDAYLNSVVTTRNLIEGAHIHGTVRRFVNISSFAVYNNSARSKSVLDESCPVEEKSERRGEAYCFAKVKQDEIVRECGESLKIPYTIVRPGYVYGPGNEAITGRVGIGSFGVFLHLGGGNTIPFTYVDNCADAIALAGLRPEAENQVINVVDDDLPTSRTFLRQYKKRVQHFQSIYLPHAVSYLLCAAWESYSNWSEGQLPAVFNRPRWYANWKRTAYSNQRLKSVLGWSQGVTTQEGMERYFEACRRKVSRA